MTSLIAKCTESWGEIKGIGSRLQRRSVGWLLVTTALSIAWMSASGFDPDNVSWGHTRITREILGEGYRAGQFEAEPFRTELKAVPGEKIGFEPQAAEEVLLGNRSNDFLPGYLAVASSVGTEKFGTDGTYGLDGISYVLTGEPFQIGAHCDDDALLVCAGYTYLQTLAARQPTTTSVTEHYARDSAVSLLEHAAELWLKPDASAADSRQALAYASVARVKAGKALHVAQDLYAHSNWSNVRLNSPSEILEQFGLGDPTSGAGEEEANRSLNQLAVPAPAPGTTLSLSQACVARTVPAASVEQIAEVERGCSADYERDWLTLMQGAPSGFSCFNAPIIPDPSKSPYAYYAETTARKPIDGEESISGLIGAWWQVHSIKIKRDILNWGNSGGNFQLAGVGASRTKVVTGHFTATQHMLLGLGTAPDDEANGGQYAKCDHGLDKSLGPLPPSKVAGINKDRPWAPFSDEGPAIAATSAPSTEFGTDLHQVASYQAALASKKILENIIAEIGKRTARDATTDRHDAMVELFLGKKPVTAFVIDTTGSMQDIMDGIRDQVTSLVNFLGPEARFALTTYGERNGIAEIRRHTDFPVRSPNSGVVSAIAEGYIANATQLIGALANLPPATGGSDCPEPTMKALLDTIRALPIGSKVYVYTDASTKDELTAAPSGGSSVRPSEEVKRLIRAKRLEVNFSVSGSCSPVSSQYYEIAALSGGQTLLVDHLGAETTVSLAGIAKTGEALYSIHFETGTLRPSERKVVAVPVESGMKRLLVTIGSESGSVQVRDPSGALAAIRPFLGGAVLDVSSPAAGFWEVAVLVPGTAAGSAPYSVKAEGAGQLRIGHVEYTSKGPVGGMAHETYMPYGMVPPSSNVRVVADVGGATPVNLISHAWDAIGEDGAVLGRLDMSRKTATQFEGTAAIQTISAGGTRPWRVRVRGTDSNGMPFSRVTRQPFDAWTHSVDIIRAPRWWVPGADHFVRLRVNNVGEPASFRLGSLQLNGPGTVTSDAAAAPIPKGNFAEFEIKVRLSAAAVPGALMNVRGDIVKEGPGAAASVPVSLTIHVSSDSDGDGVPDAHERGPNGLDERFDGNTDGVPDWQQANVISMATESKGLYYTAATSGGRFALARLTLPNGPMSYRMPLDLLELSVTGMQPGQTSQVRIVLPSQYSATGFGRVGPRLTSEVGQFSLFEFDSTTGVGAQEAPGEIVVHVRDGALGDEDGIANGSIVLAGGVTGLGYGRTQIQGAGGGGERPAAPGASGGGGGGCTLGRPGHQDHSTLLLLALASLALAWRAWACARRTRHDRHDRRNRRFR